MPTNQHPQLPLQHLKFIDLFAGIGGFHLALTEQGASCVFASEWDTAAQATYFTNHHLQPHGDITTIPTEYIPPHDILCAGFPCQAFSISGKQLGFADARGTLFFDVARIAKAHQPKMLFLENVKNFASHDNGRTLQVVKNTLESMGYSVFYKVLSSSQYGSPQKRERIYILAFHQTLNISSFQFPSPISTFQTVQDIALPLIDPTVQKAIVMRKDTILYSDRFPSDRQHNLVRVGHVNKGGQGERIYHSLGQGITLSAYGGGAGAKTGLYLIDNTVRKLTPRECARMQGFPDSFSPHSSTQQAYKQFGNSVSVHMLRAILLALHTQKIDASLQA